MCDRVSRPHSFWPMPWRRGRRLAHAGTSRIATAWGRGLGRDGLHMLGRAGLRQHLEEQLRVANADRLRRRQQHLSVDAVTLHVSAVGRAEVLELVAVGRPADHRVMARHEMVVEDNVVALHATDVDDRAGQRDVPIARKGAAPGRVRDRERCRVWGRHNVDRNAVCHTHAHSP